MAVDGAIDLVLAGSHFFGVSEKLILTLEECNQDYKILPQLKIQTDQHHAVKTNKQFCLI